MKTTYTDEARMSGVSYRKTDLRSTFARIRREQKAAAEAAKVNAEVAKIGRGRVTVMPKRTAK